MNRCIRAPGTLAFAYALLVSVPANAQNAPPPAAPGATGAAGATGATPSQSVAKPTGNAALSSSDVERARVHYDRGRELYKEQNLNAALYEFERAYELAPSYRILYNVALIQELQYNYAAALDNFRRYLTEGSAELPEDRRIEVEKQIEAIKNRVATINIVINVPGADVLVDDASVCGMGAKTCKSPLPGPVNVNAGPHKISAQKSGYVPVNVSVRVVGGDVTSAALELLPLPSGQAQGPVDSAPRTRSLVVWGVTGALAAATIVTGALTLDAKSTLTNDLDTPGIGPDRLRRDASRVKNFALATDIVGGATLVGGLAAIYFTVKATQSESELRAIPQNDRARALSFDLSPTGASISGRF